MEKVKKDIIYYRFGNESGMWTTDVMHRTLENKGHRLRRLKVPCLRKVHREIIDGVNKEINRKEFIQRRSIKVKNAIETQQNGRNLVLVVRRTVKRKRDYWNIFTPLQ